MLANVQQKTIQPIIEAAVAKGTRIYTDEYDIYARLPAWGYQHKRRPAPPSSSGRTGSSSSGCRNTLRS